MKNNNNSIVLRERHEGEGNLQVLAWATKLIIIPPASKLAGAQEQERQTARFAGFTNRVGPLFGGKLGNLGLSGLFMAQVAHSNKRFGQSDKGSCRLVT